MASSCTAIAVRSRRRRPHEGLVLNCGSSSVEFQLLETDAESARAGTDRSLAKGLAENVGGAAVLNRSRRCRDRFVKRPPMSRAAAPVVFLVDVDNTLLDNDRIQDDLRWHLEREFGAASRDRYWAILEVLFAELGYRDYLGALQRYRSEHPQDVRLMAMSS